MRVSGTVWAFSPQDRRHGSHSHSFSEKGIPLTPTAEDTYPPTPFPSSGQAPCLAVHRRRMPVLIVFPHEGDRMRMCYTSRFTPLLSPCRGVGLHTGPCLQSVSRRRPPAYSLPCANSRKGSGTEWAAQRCFMAGSYNISGTAIDSAYDSAPGPSPQPLPVCRHPVLSASPPASVIGSGGGAPWRGVGSPHALRP